MTGDRAVLAPRGRRRGRRRAAPQRRLHLDPAVVEALLAVLSFGDQVIHEAA